MKFTILLSNSGDDIHSVFLGSLRNYGLLYAASAAILSNRGVSGRSVHGNVPVAFRHYASAPSAAKRRGRAF